MRPSAIILALALAACSSSPAPEPDTSTTIAGDGDPGDGDGDSEPLPDMGEPLLDVPSEGEPACCVCGDVGPGFCELETYQTAEECGEAWDGVPWEWHTNCYEDAQAGEVVCPGSCVHPDA